MIPKSGPQQVRADADLSALREGMRPLASTITKVTGLKASGDAPLADVVCDALEHALRRGEFTPGQSLKIRPLAEALGTSQTPVREALSRLVAREVLEFHPVNRSVLVPRLAAADVKEIYSIRKSLERILVEEVAATISKADLRGLGKLRKAVESSGKANHARRFLRDNEMFLFAMYELAHMPRALSIVSGLWLQIGPTMGVLMADCEDIAETSSLHTYRELLAALEQHDAQHAGELFDARLGRVCDMICEQMQ